MPFSDRPRQSRCGFNVYFLGVCVGVCEWGLIVARAHARPHSNGQQQPGARRIGCFMALRNFQLRPS